MKHIVMFGAPGSGKGTQSKLLQKEYGFLPISTGDLLRAEVAAGTEIGKECEAVMQKGLFPDNSLIYKLVENFVKNQHNASGFIYDGFPRTIDQATFLIDMLKQSDQKIDKVIYIETDPDVLIKRIVGRFTCDKCGEIYNTFFKKTAQDGVCDKCASTAFSQRSDDTAETVKTRLEVYHQTTEPVIDFFAQAGMSIERVDGMASLEDVSKQILNIIK